MVLKQAHLYIKGDVIGVGFRAWTKIQAKLTGVFGWVRNVYERTEVFGIGGGVEVVIQGEEEKVVKMVEKIKKGPPISSIEEVKVFWEDPKEIFEEFTIKE